MTMFLTAALDLCGCRSYTGRIVFDVLFAIGLACVVVTTVVVGLRRRRSSERAQVAASSSRELSRDRYDDL